MRSIVILSCLAAATAWVLPGTAPFQFKDGENVS